MKKKEKLLLNSNDKSELRNHCLHPSYKDIEHIKVSKLSSSKTEEHSSNILQLRKFISNKQKIKFSSAFDRQGAKEFLKAKDLALQEIRLSDEIIEEELKAKISIIETNHNMNSIGSNANQCTNNTTADPGNLEKEIGGKDLKGGESPNGENLYQRRKSKISTIKTHKSRKSTKSFDPISKTNSCSNLLRKENTDNEEIKDADEEKSKKINNKSKVKRKSKFCNGHAPLVKSKSDYRLSIHLIGNVKTAETIQLIERLESIKEREKDKSEKQEKKDEKEDQSLEQSKTNKKMPKNIISIINQKEESDVNDVSLLNMIDDLKGV